MRKAFQNEARDSQTVKGFPIWGGVLNRTYYAHALRIRVTSLGREKGGHVTKASLKEE